MSLETQVGNLVTQTTALLDTVTNAIQVAEINLDVQAVDAARVVAIGDIAQDVAAVEAARVQAVNVAIPNAAESIKVINNRGAWVTGAVYALMDIVSNGGNWYVCVVAHTASASFATDEVTRWRIYQGVTAGILAAPYSNLTGESGAKSIGVRAGTADRYLEENDTRPLGYKVAQFLRQIKEKPCRMLLTGTSISQGDQSAIQVVSALLQKHYGKNRSTVYMLGVYGGTYAPSGGYKKQTFGGPGYVRLVMEPGVPDLTYSDVVDHFNLIYGKELDGGDFEVWIDNVLDATLSSNGVQAYEQIYTKSFSSTGLHKITIKAPASGFVYLERIEFGVSSPGIFVENATLGGSGLRHAYTLMTDAAGNKPGIPIQGNNGIDAFCNRTGSTKPDIIICQHFTNDGNLADFTAGLSRMVERTKVLNIPLVLISEMPAMSYVSDGIVGQGMPGTLKTDRLTFLNAILAHRDEKHVTVIDWTEMVDFSDKLAYEAKYFPSTDKTHPNLDGHAPLLQALCSMFGLPHPAGQSARVVQGEILEASSASVMPFPPVSDPVGVSRFYRNGVPGVVHDPVHSNQTMVVGEAFGLYGTSHALHYSSSVPNLVKKSDFDVIRESPTRDEFGAYITADTTTVLANFTSLVNLGKIEQDFTAVFLIRSIAGLSTFTIFSPSNNITPRVFVDGQLSNMRFFPIAPGNSKPVFCTVRFRHGLTSSDYNILRVSVSGCAVYGLWVTEGNQALICDRFSSHYRQIGFPLYSAGDPDVSDVVVGQTYLEEINSTTIEKVALDSVCWKVFEQKFARVYEMKNKGIVLATRLNAESLGVSSYNDFYGGLSAETVLRYSVSLPIVTFPYGKTVTLGLRRNSAHSYRISLFNGSNNTETYLRQDGTWVTGTVSSVEIGGCSTGFNIGFTFSMPDSSFSVALGVVPSLRIAPAGSSGFYTPPFLCEGSSACVNTETTYDTGPQKDVGAGEPTSGYYPRGFIRYNSAPSPSGALGWVCTTAGIAGSTAVFKTFGAISA